MLRSGLCLLSSAKVVSGRGEEEHDESPLTPELEEFIDAAVVPCLVRKYLRERNSKLALESSNEDAHNPARMGDTEP
jgi:hypothetical protein